MCEPVSEISRSAGTVSPAGGVTVALPVTGSNAASTATLTG
jgi:hypothetical protein